jgi:hypothetical protein
MSKFHSPLRFPVVEVEHDQVFNLRISSLPIELYSCGAVAFVN